MCFLHTISFEYACKLYKLFIVLYLEKHQAWQFFIKFYVILNLYIFASNWFSEKTKTALKVKKCFKDILLISLEIFLHLHSTVLKN